MKSLSHLTLALLTGLSLSSLALADVCALNSKEVADRAISIIKDKKYIISYCKPCNDELMRAYNVKDATAIPEGDKFAVRLWLEDGTMKKFDLAYTYVKVDESKYANLSNVAVLAKCPLVPGIPVIMNARGEVVSEALPEDLVRLDLSGYYMPAFGKDAATLKQITTLSLDSTGELKGTLETKTGRAKLARVERKGDRLSFTTEELDGVRYVFEGRFLNFKSMLRAGRVPEGKAQALKGVLRLQKDAVVQETAEVGFQFTVGD